MKGTNYVIGLFVYIASILLPVIVSSKAISYTHIALYAVFSLIIIAGATIDMHYYILPDEGALVLVIGGIIYSIYIATCYSFIKSNILYSHCFVCCVFTHHHSRCYHRYALLYIA